MFTRKLPESNVLSAAPGNLAPEAFLPVEPIPVLVGLGT